MSRGLRRLLVAAVGVSPLLAGVSAMAADASAAPTSATATSATLGEVVVTARRTSENVQNIPVSVTAITPTVMRTAGIVVPEDIQFFTPGLDVEGGSFTRIDNSYSIRGEPPEGVPVYLNEVELAEVLPYDPGFPALPYWDMSSIQVLKGPQGTLFGGTATGGAVLETTARPRNEFGGYLQASAGNYDAYNIQGAINIPIVPDKLLLRIAGYDDYRRGYTYNQYTDTWVDNSNKQDARVSITFKPTPRLQDDLLFEYDYRNEYVGNAVPILCNPAGSNNGTPPGVPNYNGAWYKLCQADVALDPRTINENLGGAAETGPQQNGIGIINNYFVSNITSYDFTDNIRARNIFGFVDLGESNSNNNGGTASTTETSDPVTPWSTARLGYIRQFTDELQFQGKNFNNLFSWTIGGFYQNDKAPQPLHLFYNGAYGVIIDIMNQENNTQFAG